MNLQTLNRTFLVGGMLLLCLSGFAQTLKMRLALKEYERMRYHDAITLFEEVLKKNPSNNEALAKLADCYLKIHDQDKILKLNERLTDCEKPSPVFVWNYAQALAANKEYEEAINWYKKYSRLVPDDTSAAHFVEAYSNYSSFYKDSAHFKVKYVPALGSWQSDFSPLYYRNGILFLSNRHQQQLVRTVYELDQSSFLDFYFASDTTTIQSELDNEVISYRKDKSSDSHDDNTSFTSNDSHIVGHYGLTYLHDSVDYHYEHLTTVERLTRAAKSKLHEGPATINSSQDTIYFTRNAPYQKSTGKKNTSKLMLYMADLRDFKWKNVRPLPFNIPEYSMGHPALSPDNKKLYFVSDRPGGKGGLDIWVANITRGVFSNPENVQEINTAKDEMFPFVATNGDLYYSTDGLPGLGGLDIYRATPHHGKFVYITNLGYPMNSQADDFGITWNHSMTKGFMSSNRKRGNLDDDIYAFEKNCRSVTVFVFDGITKAPLGATEVMLSGQKMVTDSTGRFQACLVPGGHQYSVEKEGYESYHTTSSQQFVEIPLMPLHFDLAGTVHHKQDGKAMENVIITLLNLTTNTTQKFTTSKNGTYQFALMPNESYKVVAAKKNCGSFTIDKSTIGLNLSQTLRADFELLCTGDIIKIENIFYDFNKYNIRPDAAIELDKLAALMIQYPDMRIELRSHTDSRSSATYNMQLSAKRAEAAVQYLQGHGIVASRLRAHGYGESLPLNACVDGVKCSEEEYQVNRRTEFKILSIK